MASCEDGTKRLSLETSMSSHSDFILGRVSNFWESKLLTDVSLKVQGKVLNAHKVILSACSEYFKAMFSGRMKESTAKTVNLKENGLIFEAVQALVLYMYKGRLDLTFGNVFDILVAADYLQVISVLELCCKFIVEEVVNTSLESANFNLDVFRRICSIADRHGLAEIREEAERKFALSFSDIAESTEFKKQTTLNELQRLLLRDDLACPNETFVFRAVLSWVEFDRDSRLCHVAELLRSVRLALVDIDVVISELGESGFLEVQGCRSLLFEASLYHNRPSSSSKFALEFGKPRVASKVLVAFGSSKITSYPYFFESSEKQWKLLTGMAENPCMSPYTAALSSHALYLCNGKGRCYEYCISSNKWSKLPVMHFEKQYLRLCVLEDHLYALGGSRPERYSFIKKQWQCIATPLDTQPIEGVAFAAYEGGIFAIGGGRSSKHCDEGKCSRVFVFNPITNKWKPIASTTESHYNAVAFVEKGMLYVAGGLKSAARPKPQRSKVVERYDKDNSKWHCVSQQHIPPTNDSAFEIDGKVFFIQGKAVYESSIRIPPGEVYHVSLDGWNQLQSLPLTENFVFVMVPLGSKLLQLTVSDDSSSESEAILES